MIALTPVKPITPLNYNYKIKTFLKNNMLTLFTVLLVSCGGSTGLIEEDFSDHGGNDTQQTAINKISLYAENQTITPTLQDYIDAGVNGVTLDNISNINLIIAEFSKEDTDTQNEIQSIITSQVVSTTNTDDPNDSEAPAITMYGSNPLFIMQGEKYIEPGVVALDSSDGFVKVNISGKVDETILGNYILTYTAKDATGNSSTKNRIIKVTTPDLIPLIYTSVEAKNITTTSAEIEWQLTKDSTGQVEYGETKSYGNITLKEESFSNVIHKQELNDLTPNTQYHYRIISNDENGEVVTSDDYVFSTKSSLSSDNNNSSPGVIFNENAIFVSTNGNDEAQGKTPETALRTISKAVSLAVAGDTIYVKAGLYQGEEILFPRNGTADKPITIEGYTNTPGDRPHYNFRQYSSGYISQSDEFTESTPVNSSKFPVLHGGGRANGKTAITIATGHGTNYITIRNIQITKYQNGVIGATTIKNHMNFNPSNYTVSPNWSYKISHINIKQVYIKDIGHSTFSGNGLTLSHAENCLVEDSVVVNAEGHSIFIGGFNNTVRRSKAYGSIAGLGPNGGDGPDYYFLIKGRSNLIENSFASRVGGTPHGGHGFEIASDYGSLAGGYPLGPYLQSTFNTIRLSVAKNLDVDAFKLRWKGVEHNLFQGNTTYESYIGLNISDGAANNTIERHIVHNANTGIQFADVETESLGVTGETSVNNTIKDSQFYDLTGSFIRFAGKASTKTSEAIASGNTLDNISVNGLTGKSTRLIIGGSKGINNIIQNSTFNKIESLYYWSSIPGQSSSDLGITYKSNKVFSSNEEIMEAILP